MGYFDVRCTALPYCVKKLKNGAYILLNREYKPLGWAVREYVDYDALTELHHHIKITPATAKKISHSGSDNTDMIMMYDDGSFPTRDKASTEAYFKRLAVLMAIKLPAD